MGLRWAPPFILGLAVLLAGTCSGFYSYSLRYFVTAVSEPGQQVPQFSYVGYVNDQEFVFYNASTKRYLPKVPWISKVEKFDPDYWERNSQYAQGHERSFRDHLATLAGYYNQSRGIHTFQWMYGCELKKDESTEAYYQYAYDGKDYISLNKDTLTWMAGASGPAQSTKRKWDADLANNEYKKFYLEKTCIVWLQRYLDYGKKMLLRTESPEVNVTCKADYDGMETLICRVGGFYPKDIDINWTKDGEVWMQDIFHGLVSPNSDGTYYTWRSVTVDPKEREHYKCHVEHDGLLNPVDVASEEPCKSSLVSNLGFIIAGVVIVFLLAAGCALFTVIFKKRQHCYKADSANDQGSISSGSVTYQDGSKRVSETTEAPTNDGPGQSLAHTSNMGNSEYWQSLRGIQPPPESNVNAADDGPGHRLNVANSGYCWGLGRIKQRLWEV